MIAACATHIPASGFYADESYAKRSEGYDWVGIDIAQIDREHYRVTVNSRSDTNRPTCSGNFTARVVGRDTLQVDSEQGPFQLVFGKDSLTIDSEEDDRILYYFCRGGASLIGEYHKFR
ncbi:hypothetical protein D0T92_02335 [Neisseria zalophi]|uniref:Uncharacterized protein n=2 Tax=Neisseria zalophi TaxID=640030 RepID=A0A5J6PWK4_9NEIS|nr:hypothetical protein D0T92_02335 [Neisseria zalophi]